MPLSRTLLALTVAGGFVAPTFADPKPAPAPPAPDLVFTWEEGEMSMDMSIWSTTVTVTGRVEPTSGWEDFRQAKVGELSLDAGEQRLAVRAAPPFKGILMDLRGVRLVPVKK